MQDLSGFFWAGIAGGGMSASLLALAGFLGKSQLAHWLNKDIEKLKAQHIRELENYKASLTGEVERLKAIHQVRKEAALKLQLKKFDELCNLVSAMSGLDVDLICFLQERPESRTSASYQHLARRLTALSDASGSAAPFLESETRDSLSKFRVSIFQAREALTSESAQVELSLDRLKKDLFDASVTAEALVFRELNKMQDA